MITMIIYKILTQSNFFFLSKFKCNTIYLDLPLKLYQNHFYFIF